MNSLKKGEGVSILNFEGGPGIPLLNFERGPGVPLLKFEEGPRSRVPGSQGPGSRNPGPTFTPCRIAAEYVLKTLTYLVQKESK